MGLLFHVAHVAMALAARRRLGDGEGPPGGHPRPRAPRTRTRLVGDVLVPLVEGLHAFAPGEYATTIAKIEPLRPRIVELGGSRAQRDVFHDTLFEACFRAGDAERAGRYLAERLARRPTILAARARPEWASHADALADGPRGTRPREAPVPARAAPARVALLAALRGDARPPSSAAAGRPRSGITLLQINDVYTLEPVDEGRRGGIARLATLVKRIRRENPSTVLALGGDTISPSVASTRAAGPADDRGLNALGLDLATFGNHEFDFGPAVLRRADARVDVRLALGQRARAGRRPSVRRRAARDRS